MSHGIVVNGAFRLRKGIETQVRKEYEKAISDATKSWQKIEIEKHIAKEVDARMKKVVSPYAL